MPGRDESGATIKPYVLDVDIPAYRAVVVGSAEDHCTLPGGANADDFLGYTLQDGLAGETRPIHLSGGIALATAGGAIAVGKKVNIAGATGKVAAAAPAQGVNNHIVGRALRAAAADGDVIPVLPIHETMQGA